MSEKSYENKIKRFLKEQGCWVEKYHPGSFGKAGIPDLLCCIGGKFVAIEVKAERGRASELQKEQISRINKSNGIAFISRPSQFEDLKKMVMELLGK